MNNIKYKRDKKDKTKEEFFMKEVKFNKYLEEVLDQLQRGAFLTVNYGEKLNTMTIGWGNIGINWGKPVFIAMVRDSRYTFNLIEKSTEFTVSIPALGTYKDELAFCGSKSGRDFDKFKECNLDLTPGNNVKTPLIQGCKYHIECIIKYKQRMEPENLKPELDNKWYPGKDYHTFYYGEIVGFFKED